MIRFEGEPNSEITDPEMLTMKMAIIGHKQIA